MPPSVGLCSYGQDSLDIHKNDWQAGKLPPKQTYHYESEPDGRLFSTSHIHELMECWQHIICLYSKTFGTINII